MIERKDNTMDIWWAATSLGSGYFVANETNSNIDEFVERFEDLKARGQGYLEVRRADNFPTLTFGFRRGLAVIHLMTSLESIALLVSDKTNKGDAWVPIMDDLAEFTANFVLDLDSAWQIVEKFARTGDVDNIGEWCEL
jgi:hypothetical protein